VCHDWLADQLRDVAATYADDHGLDDEDRAARAAVTRRGSLLCVGVGTLLCAFAVLVLVLS